MKKILLAFDGAHYSKGAFEFARRLNELQPVSLTGIFLPRVDFTREWAYAASGAPAFLPLIEDYNAGLEQESIQSFEQDCMRYGIPFRIHEKRIDFAMPELKKETRFADLLIVGSERFYENLGTAAPNEYLKMALHEAECPVILAPENFAFPESVVLSYDGSEDAAFAIRSFSYLFPEMRARNTVLVYASPRHDPEIPEMEYIKELSSGHFPNLSMHILEADPKKFFDTWISDIRNPILVCGSFGRSVLSEAFRTTFVSAVIKDHKIPIFIAHR